MALNKWGEPTPERLTGERGDAWALIMENNEYFDGEDGIAHSVQQGFLREWSANGPADVLSTNYRTHETVRKSFPTAREAYRYALRVRSAYDGYVMARVVAPQPVGTR